MTIKPVKSDKSEAEVSTQHRDCHNKISSPKSPVSKLRYFSYIHIYYSSPTTKNGRIFEHEFLSNIRNSFVVNTAWHRPKEHRSLTRPKLCRRSSCESTSSFYSKEVCWLISIPSAICAHYSNSIVWYAFAAHRRTAPQVAAAHRNITNNVWLAIVAVTAQMPAMSAIQPSMKPKPLALSRQRRWLATRWR